MVIHLKTWNKYILNKQNIVGTIIIYLTIKFILWEIYSMLSLLSYL